MIDWTKPVGCEDLGRALEGIDQMDGTYKVRFSGYTGTFEKESGLGHYKNCFSPSRYQLRNVPEAAAPFVVDKLGWYRMRNGEPCFIYYISKVLAYSEQTTPSLWALDGLWVSDRSQSPYDLIEYLGPEKAAVAIEVVKPENKRMKGFANVYKSGVIGYSYPSRLDAKVAANMVDNDTRFAYIEIDVEEGEGL